MISKAALGRLFLFLSGVPAGFAALAAALPAGLALDAGAAFADPAADRARLEDERQTLLADPDAHQVELPSAKLRPGDRSEAVPKLRLALAAYGFDAAENDDPQRYDPALAAEVERFQEEVGLHDDGVVGTATRRALSGWDGNRLRRIEQSLSQPTPPATGRYILVNIAAGLVYAVEDGRTVLTSPAIVGKAEREKRTPFFTGIASSFTVNPIWNAPKSIVEKEFGGNAHVEKPGPDNPLGKIRIDLPNRYEVFLHSTNKPRFFARDIRDFSHGCVRVEKIAELARWMAGDDLWVDDEVDAALATMKTQRFPLDETIPVYFLYRTASVASTGAVIYHADPYGLAAPPAPAMPPVAAPNMAAVGSPPPGLPSAAQTPAMATAIPASGQAIQPTGSIAATPAATPAPVPAPAHPAPRSPAAGGPPGAPATPADLAAEAPKPRPDPDTW